MYYFSKYLENDFPPCNFNQISNYLSKLLNINDVIPKVPDIMLDVDQLQKRFLSLKEYIINSEMHPTFNKILKQLSMMHTFPSWICFYIKLSKLLKTNIAIDKLQYVMFNHNYTMYPLFMKKKCTFFMCYKRIHCVFALSFICYFDKSFKILFHANIQW